MCAWAVNIVTFNTIFKLVDPLEKSRDAAMADLEQKKKELAVVKEKVRALNEKVNKLKKDLEEAERVK